MPLYLYTSNRLEKLASAFAELVRASPLPPLEAETVVLQSGGMARWLHMQLAEELGISANIVFPFPNGFVEDLFRGLMPDYVSTRKLDKKVLQWQLMRILPELSDRPEFAVLGGYLSGESDLKKYQLSGRLADLFDQYTIFRPEMVLDWEQGGDKSWQALLWRELVSREDCLALLENRARLQKRCLEVLDQSGPDLGLLPSRVTVFGLSTIPPYYLKIFNSLAQHIDIHIFSLNPCREFWGDIVSEKTRELLGKYNDPEKLYLTQGNPILASTGQQGKELLTMLLGFDFRAEYDFFIEPNKINLKTDMLSAVQTDILDLRDGSPLSGEILDESDRSIMVHSCHSPMRELEVLHDQLLAMFEENPDLSPNEVIVMTPDIEMYSPLVGVVFGNRKVVNGRSIPFSIADRSLKKEGKLFNALWSILELAGSRMEISRVLAIVEKEPIRKRFSLSLRELELVERWLAAVNVRWGIDGEHRRRLGLPKTVENTWRFGIDRLLLGYAMCGREQFDFAGILPWDELEGRQAEALGRFLDFLDRLFVSLEKLSGRKTLGDWAQTLLAILEEFIEVVEGQEGEHRFLLEALKGMKEVEVNGDFPGEAGFEVIMAELEKIGRSDSLSTGFMGGGVTFCEMLPMRAVPFKVVCLLGMNDNLFPRTTTVYGFDLIGRNPQIGDRSRRKDDRYLFLEAILSARQALYISYVGQSVRDGSVMPPSVLVSELVDYLVLRFSIMKDRILTTHPLQPFNPKYFGNNGKFFSYSEENFLAAQKLIQPRGNRVFIGEPLSLPEDEFRQLILEELVRFFVNPSRYFCRKRLGIFPDDDVSALEDNENFYLDHLESYRIGETILNERLTGKGGRDLFNISRLKGVMPHANVGRAAFEELAAGVEEMIGKVGITVRDGFEWIEGEFEIGADLVKGRLETSPELGQIIYRYAKLGAKDCVKGWLYHLVLDRLAPLGWNKTTKVVGKDRTLIFPGDTGGDSLIAVIDLYRQGLSFPLPFFPETSYEFAIAKRRGLGDSEAAQKAHRVWDGNGYSHADSDDLYNRLIYGKEDPFDERFMKIAQMFFEPLLDAGKLG